MMQGVSLHHNTCIPAIPVSKNPRFTSFVRIFVTAVIRIRCIFTFAPYRKGAGVDYSHVTPSSMHCKQGDELRGLGKHLVSTGSEEILIS